MLAAKRRFLRVLRKVPIEVDKEKIMLRPTKLLRIDVKYNKKIKRWEIIDMVRRDEMGPVFVQKHMKFYTDGELLQHYPELKKIIERTKR